MSEKNEILEIPFGISAAIVITIIFVVTLLLGGVGNRGKKEPVKEVIPDLVSAPVSASTLTSNESKGVETNGITEFRGIKTNLKF